MIEDRLGLKPACRKLADMAPLKLIGVEESFSTGEIVATCRSDSFGVGADSYDRLSDMVLRKTPIECAGGDFILLSFRVTIIERQWASFRHRSGVVSHYEVEFRLRRAPMHLSSAVRDFDILTA